MFDSGAQNQVSGRYQVEMVAGEMRKKSHHASVQEKLDEGSQQGWRLVSATTTNASGTYVTGIYWDTMSER